MQIFIKLYQCIIFEAIKFINLNRAPKNWLLKKRVYLTKLRMFVQPFAQVLSIVTFGRVNNVSTFVVQVGTSYSLFDLNLETLAMHEKFLVQWEWLYFKLFQAPFSLLAIFWNSTSIYNIRFTTFNHPHRFLSHLL